MLSAPTDVLTLDELKFSLGISGTTNARDAELTRILQAGIEAVEHEVGCSILERFREEAGYLFDSSPMELRFRGLLLLPAVAEDATADPPVEAREERSVQLLYTTPDGDSYAPPDGTLTIRYTAKVLYGESPPVGASPSDEPLRFGKAMIFPPAAGWPDHKGEVLLRYSTGAPSKEAVPETWRQAILEYCKDVYDRDDSGHMFVRTMLNPWRRYS